MRSIWLALICDQGNTDAFRSILVEVSKNQNDSGYVYAWSGCDMHYESDASKLHNGSA